MLTWIILQAGKFYRGGWCGRVCLPGHRHCESMMMVVVMMVAMMMVEVMMTMIVMRTMRGKLTLCAQESPSTSFIVLDPKDLKELGRWGNHDDFEY